MLHQSWVQTNNKGLENNLSNLHVNVRLDSDTKIHHNAGKLIVDGVKITIIVLFFLNTGCCTTFCKGGKTWFQIYLWLKIHFNKFEIYQRTQGNKNCLNLIKFQLSSYFFVSAHLAKIHVFLTDFLIYFTRFHFRYSTFLTLSIWQIWLFWQFIWSITHFIFKTNKLFSYSKK